MGRQLGGQMRLCATGGQTTRRIVKPSAATAHRVGQVRPTDDPPAWLRSRDGPHGSAKRPLARRRRRQPAVVDVRVHGVGDHPDALREKAEPMYDSLLAEPRNADTKAGFSSRPGPHQVRPRESRTWADQPEEPALTQALIELLKNAGRRLGEDGAEAGFCINRALSLLEAERLRRDLDHEAPPPPATGGLSPWRVRRVKQHIEENLDTTIRIDDLASIAKLSVRHFSLAFKQSFGVPPHAHIVKRRIEKARELLLRTDEPLAQVALACGLADQAHLSKWFRRLVGVTPNAWRRQYRA